MGKCFSQPKSEKRKKKSSNNEDTELIKVQPSAGAEKPKPMIFAVQRNAHEVIRGLMMGVGKSDDVASFRSNFKQFQAYMALHARTEDGGNGCKGLFAMLDERGDGLAMSAGLRDLHVNIDAAEKAIQDMTEDDGAELDALKTKWAEFEELNEAHLKKEEDIIMPQIMKMAKSGVNMKEIMREDVLAGVWDEANIEEFKEWVTISVRTLENYFPKAPKARVWIHALMASCTPEQWRVFLPAVKAGLSEELYTSINDLIEMEAKLE